MQLPEKVKSENTSRLPVIEIEEGFNPQQLAIKQLQREEFEMKEQNILIAGFHKVLAKADDQRIDIMRSINPLDEAENWLGKEIEYLYMVKDILRNYLKVDGQISNLKEIHAIYFKRLDALRQDFIEGYRERLKSRPYIFREDKFIELTKGNIPMYVNEFTVMLDQYLDNFAKKFFFSYTTGDELIVNYDLRLDEEIEAKKQRLYKLLETKTPLGERYLDIDSELGKAEQKVKKQLIGFKEAKDNSLPSLCYRGELAEVAKLIDQNIKLINQVNSTGELAIHRACEANHIEIVKFLLSKGARPETLDETKNQLSAFHYAAMYGTPKLLITLLTKGDAKNKIDEKQMLIKNQKDRTLLHSAAFANNIPVVTWLSEKKIIDINARDNFTGSSALHLAAWLGYPRIIEILLNFGANANSKNKQGDSPIYTAALYRQSSALLAFLKQGVWLKEIEVKQLFNFIKATDDRRAEHNRLFALCLDITMQNYRDIIQQHVKLMPSQTLPSWLRSPIQSSVSLTVTEPNEQLLQTKTKEAERQNLKAKP
jgi:ankyrin repeat protein